MIGATNIKVKVPASRLPVMVECPLCFHPSEIMVKLPVGLSSIPTNGKGEGACHQCGTTFTFDWSMEKTITDKMRLLREAGG